MESLVRQMNDIGENPLRQNEMKRLRKAYIREAIRHFQNRQKAKTQTKADHPEAHAHIHSESLT